MKLSIPDAFIDRQGPGASTEEIEKISHFYKQWKLEQADADSVYQVSREWLPIYEQYMTEVMQAHARHDIRGLKHMYENFFRHPLSTGLHGLHFNMVEHYMSPGKKPTTEHLRTYLESCALGARNFLLSCPATDVGKLVRPPVGNPYSYDLAGHTIYPGGDYHYTFAEKISILLRKLDHPVIMELGGGFGGMAYYCMREMPHAKYICVDLPENAALQAYYLKSHFPERKIILYGEAFTDGDYDALIMPGHHMDELKNSSINLSFNSYSLAEMSKEAMENYVRIICNKTLDYFYHLNHVYWEISADSFPIDLNKFQLLFRNPTNWGKDPSQYKLDQHEFLYKAKTSAI